MKNYALTTIALFLIFGVALGTENYMDYIADENANRDLENLREFYTFLFRRNQMDNNYPGGNTANGLVGIPYEHLMIRKSQRSPSLRLRFGRSGPVMPPPEGVLTRMRSSSPGTEDN